MIMEKTTKTQTNEATGEKLGQRLFIYALALIILSFLNNNALYTWFGGLYPGLYLHIVWYWLIKSSMLVENIILVSVFAQVKKIRTNSTGFYKTFQIGVILSFICFASVLFSYFLSILEHNGIITFEQHGDINLYSGMVYYASFIGCAAFFMIAWRKFITMIKKLNEKQMNSEDNSNIKPLIIGVWIIVIGYGVRILAFLTYNSYSYLYELSEWHFEIQIAGVAFLALGCILVQQYLKRYLSL